jgi:hypothetical protein
MLTPGWQVPPRQFPLQHKSSVTLQTAPLAEQPVFPLGMQTALVQLTNPFPQQSAVVVQAPPCGVQLSPWGETALVQATKAFPLPHPMPL